MSSLPCFYCWNRTNRNSQSGEFTQTLHSPLSNTGLTIEESLECAIGVSIHEVIPQAELSRNPLCSHCTRLLVRIVHTHQRLLAWKTDFINRAHLYAKRINQRTEEQRKERADGAVGAPTVKVETAYRSEQVRQMNENRPRVKNVRRYRSAPKTAAATPCHAMEHDHSYIAKTELAKNPGQKLSQESPLNGGIPEMNCTYPVLVVAAKRPLANNHQLEASCSSGPYKLEPGQTKRLKPTIHSDTVDVQEPGDYQYDGQNELRSVEPDDPVEENDAEDEEENNAPLSKRDQKLADKNETLRSIQRHIKCGKIERAVKNLYCVAQKRFVKSVQSLVAKELREVRGTANKIDSLRGLVTCDKLKNFNWESAWAEVQDKLPLLSAVIQAAFYQKRRNPKTHALSPTQVLARQTTVVGIILYSLRANAYKFLQTAISVELKIQGTPLRVLDRLHYLGISCRRDAGRMFRSNIKNSPPETFYNISVSKLRAMKADVQSSILPNLKFGDLSRDAKPILPCAGYSLCVENVKAFFSPAKTDPAGMALPMVFAFPFAIKHRVNSFDTKSKRLADPTVYRAAQDLPPSTFVPTQQDFTDLRLYVTEIVKEILTENLPYLEGYRPYNVPQREHAMSAKMMKESSLILMDTLRAGENKPEESCITDILDHLQKHVPMDGDRAMPVMVHSNVDTLTSMIDVKEQTELSKDKQTRSDLLEIGPEFNKESCLLQDARHDLFYVERKQFPTTAEPSQLKDHGCLYQIGDLFNFKMTVRERIYSPVSQSKHFFDLLTFVTEGMTLLLALKYTGLKELKHSPLDFPSKKAKQKVWLDRLAEKIVDRIWKQPSKEELRKITAAYRSESTEENPVFPYCCGRDTGEEMVRCHNPQCPKVWVHLKCTKPALRHVPDGDWYCSKSCASSKTYIYCSCKLWRKGAMVQCHRKESCRRHEWYHTACLNVPAGELPDEWYCCDECSLDEQDDDRVLQYSLSTLWQGLNLLVRRDIVRHGNGPMMLLMWKIDMLHFWQRNHCKLLRMGHQLLAYTGGCLPQHTTEDIIWNRVANLTGEEGANFPLDMIIESRSSAFKDIILTGQRHNIQKSYLQNCAHMGSACPDIVGEFARVLSGEPIKEYPFPLEDTVPSPKKRRKDLKVFIEEYKEDALFDYCPPRAFAKYANCKHKQPLANPDNLGRALKKLSCRLDGLRQRTEQFHRTHHVPQQEVPMPDLEQAINTDDRITDPEEYPENNDSDSTDTAEEDEEDQFSDIEDLEMQVDEIQ